MKIVSAVHKLLFFKRADMYMKKKNILRSYESKKMSECPYS